MENNIQLEEQIAIRNKVAKPLLWVGMVGISMVFAGLTSAYIVRQAAPDWLTFDLPKPFFISTLFIVLSSVALVWAKLAVKNKQQSQLVFALAAANILGLAFVIAQFYTYNFMVEAGYYLVGTNVSSSFLYILTGLHLAHIFSGNIVLAVTLVQAMRKKYTSDSHLGLSLSATYWHFLDFLWIYLLVFLLFIR